MEPNTTTAQTPNHIDVTYFPGKTVYGSLPARLAWTQDDRLTLTSVEGTQEAPIYKEIFNVAPSEIKKIKSMLDELRITTASATYRMSVAEYSTPVAAAGGVAGVAVAHGMYKTTDADAWLQRFREKGIVVSRMGYGKMFAIAFGIAILIIAIALGVFFLMEN